MNEILVRFLSVTYCPEKYPLTRTHPPCKKRPAGAHHQQRQPYLAPLRRRADASPPLPVPHPRRRLNREGGPPQEDFGGGVSNAERRGDSGVANALQDGRERRVGERKTWRKCSVRFRLILIDSTYRGNMVRTEVMSCSPVMTTYCLLAESCLLADSLRQIAALYTL